VRRVPFSCFARPDFFSAVPRASGPVFMFYAHRLVSRGTEASSPVFTFLAPDSFSAVLRALGLVFMIGAPRLFFGISEGVESCFNVLRAQTRFQRYRGRWVPFSCFACPESFSGEPRAFGLVFMFFTLGHVSGGADGVGSRFPDLISRSRFRWYRACGVPFSCFARPSSFSVVPGASGPVFFFCAPVHVFGGTEGVGSRFHVLRSQIHFRRYRGCRFPFLCYVRPDSFSAVLRASGPVFIFCTTELIFGGTEGVWSRFHVLRAQTQFLRY
jgi:hypothetical protein